MKTAYTDLFGCFGNTFSENILALFWPCLLYGEMHHWDKKGPLGFWTGCLCYTFCCTWPCIPGTLLRTSRGENTLEGCLSYCFCPCCALLQDQRRYLAAKIDE